MDSLCTHCSALFSSQDQAPPLGAISHHQIIGQLRQSAADCALCKTIYDFSSLSYLKTRFPEVEAQASDLLPIALKVVTVDHLKTTGVFWFILQGEISVKHYNFAARFKLTITSHLKDSSLSYSPLWKGQEPSFEQRCILIRKWLNDCISNHPDCSPHHNEPHHYPSRLVYVGSEDQIPRVVDTKSSSLQNVTYAALSHCWGDLQPLKLKKNNVLELKDGIPLGDIPRTFLEAIKLMRRLEIQYLWIDSLCIIQDDSEDWAREAARMNQIYSGSSLVVSAEDSQNGMQGCFVDVEQDLDASSQTPVRTLSVQPQDLDTTIDLRVYYEDLEHPRTINVLRTRGWALQEQLLAHREVICTRPELRWRCQHMQKTETGHEFAIRESLYRGILSRTAEESKWLWCDWMSDYSSRDFTFPSDRLSALVGIIHHYSERTGFRHVLACWRETMIDDLLWIRGKDLVKSGKSLPFIPSWSWISRAEDVSFDVWKHRAGHGPYTSQEEDETAVIQADIDWAGEPMISKLLSSKLVLEGPLQEMKVQVDPRALAYNPPYLNIGDEEPEVGRSDQGGNPIPWRCAGQFDSEITRVDNRYMCLLMRTVRSKGETDGCAFSHVSETFLILTTEASTEEAEVFRRVGIATVSGRESTFSNARRTRVRLI